MSRGQLPALLLLFAILLLRGWWQRQPPTQAAAIPSAAAEAWMLRALPGIGPATAPELLEQLRAGDVSAFPEEAGRLARHLFLLPKE